MDLNDLLPTGTCDLTTIGRRTGRARRVEIWYVVVDGLLVVTGTPGSRDWLANVRAEPGSVLHLRQPALDVEVTAREVVDEVERRRLVPLIWRVQPWYAAQGHLLEEWVTRAPIVQLIPT